MEFFNVNCQAHIKKDRTSRQWRYNSTNFNARAPIRKFRFLKADCWAVVVDRSFLAWKFVHNNHFNGLNSFVMMIGTWSTRATKSSGYLLLPSKIFKSKVGYINFFY